MELAVIIGESSTPRLFSEGIFPHCGIVAAKEFTSVSCPAAVIVGRSAPPFRLCSAAALIVDADHPEDISAHGGITVVTCGRGSCNTVSISSLTEERVTLSLNRSLQTLNGICEPLEQSFPLIPDIPLYDYMAAFAACIVSGIIS